MRDLQVTTGEKPPNKSAFKVKNVKYHIALKCLIRQICYGYRCESNIAILYEGSLELKQTVPSTFKKLNFLSS